MVDLFSVALTSIISNEVLSSAISSIGTISTIGSLLDLLSSKFRKESLQDQMIICLDESLEEACKQLGWEYDSLAFSQDFDSQSFLKWKDSVMTKSDLIRFFGALTGMQIDDNAADVFIQCFDRSIANKPELQRYINFLKNQYNIENGREFGNKLHEERVEYIKKNK